MTQFEREAAKAKSRIYDLCEQAGVPALSDLFDIAIDRSGECERFEGLARLLHERGQLDVLYEATVGPAVDTLMTYAAHFRMDRLLQSSGDAPSARAADAA